MVSSPPARLPACRPPARLPPRAPRGSIAQVLCALFPPPGHGGGRGREASTVGSGSSTSGLAKSQSAKASKQAKASKLRQLSSPKRLLELPVFSTAVLREADFDALYMVRVAAAPQAHQRQPLPLAGY